MIVGHIGGGDGGGGEIDTGDIANSLRFRGSQSLTRTIGGSLTTNTWMFWVKRGTLGGRQVLEGWSNAINAAVSIEFDASNRLTFSQTATVVTIQKTTLAVFRDPTAWLCIICVLDTNNAVAEDRVRIFINGERVTSWAVNTIPTLGLSTWWGSTFPQTIGNQTNGGTFLNGYLSRVCFVDGQALTPDSFGYLNTTINEWVSKSQSEVKAVVDAGGTNSFMLDFDDATRLAADAVPIMTSNTAPSGTASASTELNATHAAWKAFDKNTGNYGWITLFGTTTGWLAYEFTSATTITSYSLYLYLSAQATRMPKTWTFEGWTGAAWTVLHTVTNDTGSWAGGERRKYIVSSPSSYIEYRINVSANHGSTEYLEIDGMELFDGKGLGKDLSNKHNNWTLNNISLTAGTSYDHMLDVPGNSYAVLSGIDKHPTATLSNGALSITGAANLPARATVFVGAGKWYWECVQTAFSAAVIVGVAKNNATLTTYIGFDAGGYGYASTARRYNSAISIAYGATFGLNDVIGVALDLAAGTLTFYKNGVSQGVAYSSLSGEFSPAYSTGISSTGAFNFGQAPLSSGATYHSAAGGYFRYEPPTGFLALCQANLPDPEILNPETDFDVVLATGANIKTTAEAVFPGNSLIWIKDRANANNHQLIDTVRGSAAVLQSNTTAAETTYAAPAGSSVAWCWKAGGAAVTNNAGSISSQVSANVDAGFSIVTYTGTGANATVGHGLGVAPAMVIVKRRNSTGDWPVQHRSVSASNVLWLTLTNAQTASTTFQQIYPTSSFFYVSGDNTNVGASGSTYVAYCFAEIPGYSKIGSYTGNAAADGVYVDLGFKPAFVMVKCSSTTGNWTIFDGSRPGYNVQGGQLYPNLTNAEATTATIDFTSRGFKARLTTDPNSAQTFIYYAVADTTGKYSAAR